MSSILKALKKLETAPTGKVDILPLSQAVDPGRVIGQSRQMRRSWVMLYLLLAFCILAGGIFLGYQVVHRQSRGLLSVESLVPRVEEVGGGKVGSGSAIDRQMGTAPGSGTVPSSTVPIDRVLPAPQKERTAEALSAAGALQVSAQSTSAAAGKQESPASAADSIPDFEQVAGKVPAVPPADEKDRLLPRLAYTVMQLQAITWAEQPRDRFTLVDNKILRKGDSINDYIIDSIAEEYIVVRQGGRRWRVDFRLR